MSSTWELKEKSTGELKVTVEGEAWKKAQKKALNKLTKKVNLPGFRKGHAPASLIKKQIGMQNILLEAIDEVAGEALTSAVAEHELTLVARPSLDIESIDEEKTVLVFGVTVKPVVTLGAYKNLDIKKDEVVVTDEDVQEELVALQGRNADLVLKEDGKVENGDTAVIDFEGFKDGVPFEGGKGDAYPLVIGSGSFIPGFEEQLLGMASEETKEINVTFPEEYQAEELAGQAVVFKVTVHEIKAKELPELNDELIKEAKIEGVETVDAYKEYARKNLETNRTNAADQKFEHELIDAICDASEVEIPDVMVEDEIDGMVKDFEQRLTSQGLDLDQFKQVTGQTDETIREEIGKDAPAKVKVRLVLEAIADAENITITDEEADKELETIASAYSMPLEQIKPLINREALDYDLRIRKAVELVKESAGK